MMEFALGQATGIMLAAVAMIAAVAFVVVVAGRKP